MLILAFAVRVAFINVPTFFIVFLVCFPNTFVIPGRNLLLVFLHEYSSYCPRRPCIIFYPAFALLVAFCFSNPVRWSQQYTMYSIWFPSSFIRDCFFFFKYRWLLRRVIDGGPHVTLLFRVEHKVWGGAFDLTAFSTGRHPANLTSVPIGRFRDKTKIRAWTQSHKLGDRKYS